MAESGAAVSAKAAGAGNSNTPGIITLVTLFVCVPAFLFGGLVFGGQRGDGPNAGGATTPQAIDVRPNAPLAGLIADLKTATSTDAYLREHTTALTDFQLKLTQFSQKLAANDPALASIQNRDKVQAQVQVILTDVNAIQAAVTSANKTALPALGQKFRDDIAKLDGFAVSSIFTLAKSLAAENVAAGGKKYPYSQDVSIRAELFNTGTGGSDCSAFVSYLLKKAGVTGLGLQNTEGLYGAAKKGSSGLKIVAESTLSSGLDWNTVTSTLKPGDIILSGNDSYSGDPAKETHHAVMFIGDDTIAQSTTGGVQVNKLEVRKNRPNQVIIRWTGLPTT